MSENLHEWQGDVMTLQVGERPVKILPSRAPGPFGAEAIGRRNGSRGGTVRGRAAGRVVKQRLDDEWFDRLEAAIDRAEEKTAVEIVVAVVPRSGSYADVDWATGSSVAFIGLLFIVFNPWTVHSPWFLPFEVALLFAAGCLGSHVFPRWRNLCTSAGRRRQQVETAAHAFFSQQGIGHTRHRTGMLVYVSLEEGITLVIGDSGIVNGVPAKVWTECLSTLEELAGRSAVAAELAGRVEALGGPLGEHLPPGDDNPDELPNQPHRVE